MANLSALAALLLIAVYLTGSLGTPTLQPQNNPTGGPRSVPTQILANLNPEPNIEDFPWHVFARFSNQVCSGIIIHKDWVVLLQSCSTDAGINVDSDYNITVHAGGETPERVQQVVNARIHPISNDADPLEGVTILHLETALVFDSKKVQPARLPSVDATYTYTYSESGGATAGFSVNETTEIRLKAFSANVLDSGCPNRELLCVKSDSDSDWPIENSHTRGTDYLEIIDYYDPSLDAYFICVVGARNSTVENSLLVEYYPTFKMSFWIAENLGLRVAPSPNVASPCGYLKLLSSLHSSMLNT